MVEIKAMEYPVWGGGVTVPGKANWLHTGQKMADQSSAHHRSGPEAYWPLVWKRRMQSIHHCNQYNHNVHLKL